MKALIFLLFWPFSHRFKKESLYIFTFQLSFQDLGVPSKLTPLHREIMNLMKKYTFPYS